MWQPYTKDGLACDRRSRACVVKALLAWEQYPESKQDEVERRTHCDRRRRALGSVYNGLTPKVGPIAEWRVLGAKRRKAAVQSAPQIGRFSPQFEPFPARSQTATLTETSHSIGPGRRSGALGPIDMNRPGIAGGQFYQVKQPWACRPAWRSSALRPRQAGHCRWARSAGGC